MLFGAVLAALVSAIAWRLRLLTMGGALAATAIGAAAAYAGVTWVVLLLFFFVSSNLAGRWRRGERDGTASMEDMVAKGSRRDARQVIANGGIFGVAALASSLWDPVAWTAAGAGAIAAAMSDTWSTEVGTRSGQVPRLILTGHRVAPGTSGGVTWMGTAGAAAGAAFAGLLSFGLGWEISPVGVVAGGLGGSLLDSLAGATIQERRRCQSCNTSTEQIVHRCGTPTVRVGGIPGLDNDTTNLLCTLAGAVIAWWLR